jgi:hypothetical protein
MKKSHPRIALRGFKVSTGGAGHVPGELETAIMELFWKEHDLTVTDVEDKLRVSRQIAHTTVLTTFDCQSDSRCTRAYENISAASASTQLQILESALNKSIKSWDKAEGEWQRLSIQYRRFILN